MKDLEPGWALLLLHPAEAKGLLVEPVDPSGGLVIQNRAFEPYYLRVLRTDRHGNVQESYRIVHAPGTVLTAHWSREGGQWVPLTHNSETTNTYMETFDPDFDDGFAGDCEIVWKARFYDSAGNLVNSHDVIDNDYPCPNRKVYTDPGLLMIDDAPLNAGEEIRVTVVEQDATSGNDNYGTLAWGPSDDGAWLSNTYWAAELRWVAPSDSESGGGNTGGGCPECLEPEGGSQ